MRDMTPRKSTITLPNTNPIRRSWGLRGICLTLALIGLVNLIQAVRALVFAPEYTALNVRFPVWLAAIAGVLWGVLFGWLAWRMWRQRNLTGWEVFILVGVYGLFQIIWWRVFATADYALSRWPFATVAMALFAGGLSWYSGRLIRKNRFLRYRDPMQGASGSPEAETSNITDNEGINR